MTVEHLVGQELRQTLSHVLWIGGGTDAGKTTVSQIVAERYGLRVYNCDRHDLSQIKRLAQTDASYRAFLAASLDDNWVHHEPEDLLQFTLQAFRDRFPLVVEDLVALPREPMVVAESHGLIPELVALVLSSKHQATWLLPTEEFKWISMKRRNKPSFRDGTGDPERATANVFIVGFPSVFPPFPPPNRAEPFYSRYGWRQASAESSCSMCDLQACAAEIRGGAITAPPPLLLSHQGRRGATERQATSAPGRRSSPDDQS